MHSLYVSCILDHLDGHYRNVKLGFARWVLYPSYMCLV